MNTDHENNEVIKSDFDEFAPSYADLPMEIIIKIFRYLNFMDIQSASLTCHRWLEASQDKEFQMNIQLNFSKIYLSDQSEPIENFLKSFRTFKNLKLSHIEYGLSDKFFKLHGKYIENLILDTIDINEKEFIQILKDIKNLKSLNIINCSSLFMAGQFFETITNNDYDNLIKIMINIKKLSLRMNQYLSDMILLRLTSLIKNLESLDMFGCHIAYHNMIQKRFYPSVSSSAAGSGGSGASSSTPSSSSSSNNNNSNNVPSIPDNPSESILTFKYLLYVIQKNVKTLRELDLSLTLVGGQALIALSEIKELNLFKLKLSYCQQLNYNGFSNLFLTQKNLIHLDISYSIHITDICIDIIIDNLKNSLKILKLNNCIKLTNQSIIKLKQLKLLKVLDISHCDSITSDGLLNGILSEKNYTLNELYLTSIDLCELCIIRCTENLPNLYVFDIGCCVNGVTDQAVQSIIKNLIWLRVLNLEGCNLITDAAITGIDIKSHLDANSTLTTDLNLKDSKNDDNSNNYYSERSSSSLNYYVTNESPNIRISLRSKTEEEIYQDAQRKKIMLAICEMNNLINNDDNNINKLISDGLSIKQLKGLQCLNLRGCNKISDISLKYGLNFLELKKLYLSNCQQISYIGIDALVKNCPSIEDIDISDCHNINDKSIESITKYLKRLKSLNISGCTQLTDYSLDYIVLNCNVLQKLSVRRCRRMCSDIDLRLSALSTLRSIDMDCSSSIESADIIRMKKPVPPWNY